MLRNQTSEQKLERPEQMMEAQTSEQKLERSEQMMEVLARARDGG